MKRMWYLFIVVFMSMGAIHAAPGTPSFEALFIQPDGTSQRVFIVTATKVSVRYREFQEHNEVKDLKIRDLAKIHVFSPPAFEAAMDLFQDRRYQEAKLAFSSLAKSFAPVAILPGNPGTLAEYYELECLRKLGNLDGLSEALKKFNKDPLVREDHLRQLEIYVMWDAVRVKNWQRVEALAQDRMKQRLPGDQRAQVSFCYALALEALGRPREALNEYNTVMISDVGASEELAQKAALAILKIYLADPAVKEALKRESPSNSGPAALMEARGVAKLYQDSLGLGQALPEEYRVFLK